MVWGLSYTNTSRATYAKLIQQLDSLASENDLPLQCYDGKNAYELLNTSIELAETEGIVTPLYETIMEGAVVMLDKKHSVHARLSFNTPFVFHLNGVDFTLPLITYEMNV